MIFKDALLKADVQGEHWRVVQCVNNHYLYKYLNRVT